MPKRYAIGITLIGPSLPATTPPSSANDDDDLISLRVIAQELGGPQLGGPQLGGVAQAAHCRRAAAVAHLAPTQETCSDRAMVQALFSEPSLRQVLEHGDIPKAAAAQLARPLHHELSKGPAFRMQSMRKRAMRFCSSSDRSTSQAQASSASSGG